MIQFHVSNFDPLESAYEDVDDADCVVLSDEVENRENDSTNLSEQCVAVQQKIYTNTFSGIEPTVLDSAMTTTRERQSYFLVYSESDDYALGCEFTFRRAGKFPRYECKTCRKLCDADKKSGLPFTKCNKKITAHSTKEKESYFGFS